MKGGISLICQNATVQVCRAWIRIYYVLCSKTYSTFGGLFWNPAGLQWAPRGTSICETHLLRPGPIFNLWLSKVWANGRRHYIYNIFSHWLRPCWAINRNWSLTTDICIRQLGSSMVLVMAWCFLSATALPKTMLGYLSPINWQGTTSVEHFILKICLHPDK